MPKRVFCDDPKSGFGLSENYCGTYYSTEREIEAVPKRSVMTGEPMSSRGGRFLVPVLAQVHVLSAPSLGI